LIEVNQEISDFLLQVRSFDLTKYDAAFVNASLKKRMEETLCASYKEYGCLLMQNSIEQKAFIDSLNIHYSEFFRNPLTFAVLERIVLPSLILQKENTNRRELRIWSAACAAGQEAYSLAILLEELKSYKENLFTYRIFATDQNPARIDEAKAGQYTAEALNNMSLRRAKEWFVKQNEGYVINPVIKANIDFSVFDLLNTQFACPPTSIFGDFDIIVCANLLFYYTPELAARILEKANNCLADEGYFIIGEAEQGIVRKQSAFYSVFPSSAVFQKKAGKGI